MTVEVDYTKLNSEELRKLATTERGNTDLLRAVNGELQRRADEKQAFIEALDYPAGRPQIERHEYIRKALYFRGFAPKDVESVLYLLRDHLKGGLVDDFD